MVIEIRLDMKTPTVNHLYGQRPGGFGRARFLKPEARALRKEIEEIVWNTSVDPIRDPPRKLKVSVDIHEDWFTKKGDVKRKDVANREKFLIDSVFGSLGIDDKMIFEHTIRKVQDSKEFAVIKIEVMD